MRLLIVVSGLLALLRPAVAQITLPPAKAATSVVTVLSDALSEPGSPASQILSEISVMLDKDGQVRLLAINSYGGPANVRDLLQLRGADFAILNSDVLAYLDLASALPEARRKLRVIAPLLDQSVFLFAKPAIKSIKDLRGRKVGVPASRPSRGVTARTVFGLLKIEAEVLELEDKELASRASELDALLLYDQDLPSRQALGVTASSHHLLPVTAAGPLGAAYLPKRLGKATAAGFGSAEAIDTIQVTALLAAFDWTAKQGRYADVVDFVEKFFALVPQFRARNANSRFSKTDVRTNLPGWKRFGPAEALAAAAPPVAIKQDSVPPVTAETPASASALRVAVVARPPLLNPQDQDGGVAMKILDSALGAAGVPVSLHWVNGDRALLDEVVTNKMADVGVFWQTPHCDAPSNQSALEAELCDRALLSEPLMHAIRAVISRIDMPLDTKTADAAQDRPVCVPESQSVPNEELAAIPWIKAANVRILRRKTVIDCLAAVDAHEADALIAIEPEARFAIEKLKLSQSFQISQRASVAAGVHAIVAKDNPLQAQLLQMINEALAKFRSSGGYSAVMASHLANLTGATLTQP